MPATETVDSSNALLSARLAGRRLGMVASRGVRAVREATEAADRADAEGVQRLAWEADGVLREVVMAQADFDRSVELAALSSLAGGEDEGQRAAFQHAANRFAAIPIKMQLPRPGDVPAVVPAIGGLGNITRSRETADRLRQFVERHVTGKMNRLPHWTGENAKAINQTAASVAQDAFSTGAATSRVMGATGLVAGMLRAKEREIRGETAPAMLSPEMQLIAQRSGLPVTRGLAGLDAGGFLIPGTNTTISNSALYVIGGGLLLLFGSVLLSGGSAPAAAAPTIVVVPAAPTPAAKVQAQAVAGILERRGAHATVAAYPGRGSDMRNVRARPKRRRRRR